MPCQISDYAYLRCTLNLKKALKAQKLLAFPSPFNLTLLDLISSCLYTVLTITPIYTLTPTTMADQKWITQVEGIFSTAYTYHPKHPPAPNETADI